MVTITPTILPWTRSHAAREHARSSWAPPSARQPRSRRARRLRPKDRKRETPAGLAAFEEAPCYRELVERERDAP